jgi:O-antigen/teichoic acid export membrane protein
MTDLARGLRAMLAADLLRVLSKGLLVLVLARVLLTPAEYGLLYLALPILGTVKLLSNFGLPKSTARYVTEYVEKRPGQVPHLIRFSFGVNAVTITVASVGLVLASESIAAVLDEPALAGLLVVGVGYVVTRSLAGHVGVLFQAFSDVRWSALVRTVSSVGQVTLAAALVVLGFGVVGALWGFVLAGVVSTTIGLLVLYRRFYRQYDPDDGMESGLRRRVLRYSVPLTATKAANLLDKRVDAILVGYFMNPVAVGYYTLAKQISEFVMTPAASLGFTVSPEFGAHKASGNMERAANLYRSAFTSVVTLYVPAAAGMALVARPGVRYVFGADYLGAVVAVQVFGVYTLLLALDKTTNDGLDYLGRATARAWAKALTSVANVGLNLVMIPRYGVAGAAVATVITVSVLVVVELYVVVVELPVSARDLAVDTGRATLVAAGMSIVVYALLPYVSGLLSLFGVVGAGLAVWATLATASGALDVRRVRAVLG